MTTLPDGRLLALAEAPAKDGWGHAALGGGVTWENLFYRHSRPGFAPTAACALPGGEILVLERFYTPAEGVKARLTLIPAGEPAAGARLRPRELALLEPPFPVDNLEAMAARREGERTLVYLLSDDNYSPLQRTLLLCFALP